MSTVPLMPSYGNRFSRQVLLQHWDQEKISNATVLIPGVGALGTVVAYSLAQLGIGKLILVDFDYVDESNLSRQKLFTIEDIGHPKVIAARKALLKINPSVRIEIFPINILHLPERVWQEADVYGDGLDSFIMREHVNAKAIQYNKPYVFAGTYGWHGNVQVIIPGKTPCLDCYPMSRGEFEGSCSLSDTRKEIQSDTIPAPAIATISDIIGGMETNEIIKLLLGIPLQYNYWFYNGISGELFHFNLERNSKCSICFPLAEIIEIPISKGESVSDALKRHNISEDIVVCDGKMVDLNAQAEQYLGKELILPKKRIKFAKGKQ
ncbi:MAG: HesA/MoeB/ThiF family protein [Candidatus Korarchaeota archaeon]